jgi:tight adherence protein B
VRDLRGLAALAVALVVAPTALAAPGGIRIAGVDTSGYPRLIVNVVTSSPVGTAPQLREGASPVAPLEAVNLGRAKSVVLAIDNSQSMSGAALADATAAARAFVELKAGGDRISVVSFGRHVLQLTGFSASPGAADAVLRNLAVDDASGTALYDAVVGAARGLRSDAQPGRVIVLVTDGRDVSSTATLGEAVAAARGAKASVYPIGIESRDFDAAALRQLAAQTGGTFHGAGSSAELRQVYASIASELGRTWRIGYDTAARPGDRLRLRASLPGGGSAEQTVTVPDGLDQAGAAVSGPLPPAAYSPLGTLVVALLVGAFVLGALYALFRMQRGSWVQRRLAAHVAHTSRDGVGRGERLSFLKALFRATEGAFGRRSQWRSIDRMLVRADLPLRTAEFLWLMLGCGLGALVLFGAAGAPILLTLVATIAAGAGPYVFVSFRVRRRAKAFEDQLPDLLTTIAASLKAGHSFKHGLQAVVEEAQPPASVELRRVLTEAGLGRPLDDALGDMAERVGSENFAFAITAVTIQRQVGGSLATLFDMVSETVRNRQQFARKIRSLTAMGRMSAYTLVGVPFFIGGVVTLMNPSYMSPLYHSNAGHFLLITGLVFMGIGSTILKKMVSFRG